MWFRGILVKLATVREGHDREGEEFEEKDRKTGRTDRMDRQE